MVSARNTSKSILILALLSLGLAACQNSNGNRRFQNPGYVGPTVNSMAPYISPNGAIVCNPNDMNPTSQSSPYNRSSNCFNPNIANSNPQISDQIGQNNIVPGISPNTSGVPGINQPNYLNTNYQQQMLIQQTSTDIPQDGSGRIIRRTFHLAGGAGIESVYDCESNRDDSGSTKPSYTVSRFLYPVRSNYINPTLPSNYYEQGDRFDLIFDDQGILSVRAKSGVAVYISRGPIPYQLNDVAQTIEIPVIDLVGAPTRDFTQRQAFIARSRDRKDDFMTKEELKIKGPIPDDLRDMIAPGYRPSQGFTLGGPAVNANNGAIQPGISPVSLSSALSGQLGGSSSAQYENPNRNPNLARLTLTNFVGLVRTYPENPLHITGIVVPEVQFDSSSYIDTRRSSCEAQGSGSLVKLSFK